MGLGLCVCVHLPAHNGAFAVSLSLMEVIINSGGCAQGRAESSMSSFWCELCSEQDQEHFLGNVSFSLNIL